LLKEIQERKQIMQGLVDLFLVCSTVQISFASGRVAAWDLARVVSLAFDQIED